tara:strand:- start:140 stop:517 length:378 start_codon:yes stop_codon:yes gene_type:complete
MMQYPEMNSKEIYEEFVELKPKSCPPFNRLCQLMRCKWFVNTGETTSRANNAKRYAIWEIVPEYRNYPPIRVHKSSKLKHEGGRKNYPDCEYLEESFPTSEPQVDESPNIFDEYDDILTDSCSSY